MHIVITTLCVTRSEHSLAKKVLTELEEDANL